jgi:DNA-binding Lrp family transcriptional regulator
LALAGSLKAGIPRPARAKRTHPKVNCEQFADTHHTQGIRFLPTAKAGGRHKQEPSMNGQAGRFADLPASAAADETDLALIERLVANGRVSAADMAQAVGLSSDAVRDRVRRLLDTGLVQVVGSVNPATVGLSVLAMIGVRVSGPIEAVGETLAAAKSVDFVACVGGSFDLLVEVVASSVTDVLTIVDTQIRAVSEVRSTEVFLYASVEKWAPGKHTSHDLPSVVLDPDDRAIVEELRADGRITYRDLAARTGISYPTARRKAISLVERGVIRIVTNVNRLALGGYAQAAVGVRVSGDLEKVLDQLRTLPEIDVVTATAGRFDLLLDVDASDPDALLRFVHREVRALPGVSDTETFPYLKVLKVPFSWSIPDRS